jgi:hypothetical protein
VRQEDYAKPDEEINVPDLGQSIRVMPEAVSKLGLLDVKTIGAVVEAYAMAEEHSAKLPRRLLAAFAKSWRRE